MIARHRPRGRRRRAGRAGRPQRRRQEHPAARRRRAARAERGSIEAPAGCALLTPASRRLLRPRARRRGAARARRARPALEVVGLDVDPSRDPRDLSGGERQRLALAIAMAGRGAGGSAARPRLPRRADPRARPRAARRTLAGWLARARGGRGSAVLVATHDVEFAARFATRVVLLARGRAARRRQPARGARRRLVLRHRDRADHRRPRDHARRPGAELLRRPPVATEAVA